ncbi:MAG: hypothetical protein EOO12_01095 [Chitinophagaceae bacterium]|nr:MAG: hypothetical protein EOO12_01095 [Chitinophagaceae bacterium]
MWLRNVTLVMIVFCLILFAVFGLSGILYDAKTYLWYAIAFFIFGTAYSLSVLFLALLHDILPRSALLLRWMFLCALIPTSLFCWALWVMAFG